MREGRKKEASKVKQTTRQVYIATEDGPSGDLSISSRTVKLILLHMYLITCPLYFLVANVHKQIQAIAKWNIYDPEIGKTDIGCFQVPIKIG